MHPQSTYNTQDKALAQALERAHRYVQAMPSWKKNVLVNSMKSTTTTPRPETKFIEESSE